jgi:hypothetical protein
MAVWCVCVCFELVFLAGKARGVMEEDTRLCAYPVDRTPKTIREGIDESDSCRSARRHLDSDAPVQPVRTSAASRHGLHAADMAASHAARPIGRQDWRWPELQNACSSCLLQYGHEAQCAVPGQ